MKPPSDLMYHFIPQGFYFNGIFSRLQRKTDESSVNIELQEYLVNIFNLTFL